MRPADPPHEGEPEARSARAAFGLSETDTVTDIVRLVERRGGVPVFLAPMPSPVAGLSQRLNGRWFVVADSTVEKPGRLRFTIAHELGHVWMKHGPSIDSEKTMSMRTSGEPQEVAANYFAAEFLMPREMVGTAFEDAGCPEDCQQLVYELAARAGTTPWVPLFRLATCGFLSKMQQTQLRLAIEASLPTWVSPTPLGDVCDRYAGTGLTRKPDEHDARLLSLGDLAPGEPSDDA